MAPSPNSNCIICKSNLAEKRYDDSMLYTVTCPKCGSYRGDHLTLKIDYQLTETQIYKMSCWIRNKNFANEIPMLTADFIGSLLPTIQEPLPEKKLHHAMRILGIKSKYPGFPSQIVYDRDAPLFWSHHSRELIWLVNQLKKIDYIDARVAPGECECSLTAAGWNFYDQLKNFTVESRQVFVAMWFSPELNPIWEHGFRAAIESDEVNYTARRIDKKEHDNKIDDEIIKEIRQSRLLIADVTGQRGGVYYEAGFAQGLGLQVIWTCRKNEMEKLHFDTRQYNHIDWSEATDLRIRLINRIKAGNY